MERCALNTPVVRSQPARRRRGCRGQGAGSLQRLLRRRVLHGTSGRVQCGQPPHTEVGLCLSPEH